MHDSHQIVNIIPYSFGSATGIYHANNVKYYSCWCPSTCRRQVIRSLFFFVFWLRRTDGSFYYTRCGFSHLRCLVVDKSEKLMPHIILQHGLLQIPYRVSSNHLLSQLCDRYCASGTPNNVGIDDIQVMLEQRASSLRHQRHHLCPRLICNI